MMRRKAFANMLGSIHRRSLSTTTASTTSPRSREEVAKLVQLRVAERDAWQGPRQPTGTEFLKTMWEHRGSFAPDIPSQEELDRVFPLASLDWKLLQDPTSDLQVTWFGHSSLFVQIGGCNILTDPVFGERASPLSWMGPRRYRPTPCSLEEVVHKLKIDLVCLSHNHYDHLCYGTVSELAEKFPDLQFVVPLGLREWLHRYVTKVHQIHELDWHESVVPTTNDNLTVTSLPMKHWSNRIGDKDQSLWCGYVFQQPQSGRKFLFPGDTAWFDGLYEVGDQYGPFDMAAIPIGAYEPRNFMKASHINVEEAVEMKRAVQAKVAVPIHWGTFPLTTEPVMEPRDKLEEEEDDSFQPWQIGETKSV